MVSAMPVIYRTIDLVVKIRKGGFAALAGKGNVGRISIRIEDYV